ncbi:MAG: C_GCAxxG_C_C family protein [Ruminococcus sp.]|nr:C_GCAxxG_C_C family protein [Ruminococcus sp.]
MVENHAEKACRLFMEGRNCAQAVFAAFSDITGIDEELSLRLSSSFGGGMGRMREVCGAVSGMFMVAGVLYGYSSADDDAEKAEHYRRIQLLAEKFKEKYNTINCGELLKNLKVNTNPVPEKRTEEYYKARPCIRFVEAAAEILDEYIECNPL